jgi:hypothetical protein
LASAINAIPKFLWKKSGGATAMDAANHRQGKVKAGRMFGRGAATRRPLEF